MTAATNPRHVNGLFWALQTEACEVKRARLANALVRELTPLVERGARLRARQAGADHQGEEFAGAAWLGVATVLGPAITAPPPAVVRSPVGLLVTAAKRGTTLHANGAAGARISGTAASQVRAQRVLSWVAKRQAALGYELDAHEIVAGFNEEQQMRRSNAAKQGALVTLVEVEQILAGNRPTVTTITPDEPSHAITKATSIPGHEQTVTDDLDVQRAVQRTAAELRNFPNPVLDRVADLVFVDPMSRVGVAELADRLNETTSTVRAAIDVLRHVLSEALGRTARSPLPDRLFGFAMRASNPKPKLARAGSVRVVPVALFDLDPAGPGAGGSAGGPPPCDPSRISPKACRVTGQGHTVGQLPLFDLAPGPGPRTQVGLAA